MPAPPLVCSADLAGIGPLRLLYAPGAGEVAAGMACAPVAAWVERAKASASGLDDLAFWQAEIAALGLGPDAVTVVADDGRMTEAARVWFILQYFGLPACVLDGGIAALAVPPAQAAPCDVPPDLRPGSGPVGLMDRAALKVALGQVQVFDARTAEEFSGRDLKGNPRGGHLPGAALLDHRDLLDGPRLRPVSEVAALMAQAGIGGGRPVVTHCNGGGRAALAALAAVLAGQADVRVYYLSFADWAADDSCPLRKPEE
jgi:thiosulfate/3-mercaptopyruvate sulfurtransferase